MIWYVDIEHEKALADASRAQGFVNVRNERARILAEISGQPCEPIYYRYVTLKLAHRAKLQAIVISGNTTDWEEYNFRTFNHLMELVQSGEFPTLAICGGHQLLGMMYGGRCAAIRQLHPGEEDKGGFAPGWFKEVGYMPIQVVQDDAASTGLFAGLGRQPILYESHYWEIKEIPPVFDLLASSPDVRVQAIRHRSLPIYGTQFHPEVHSAEYPAGRLLLQNFFRLAGDHTSFV